MIIDRAGMGVLHVLELGDVVEIERLSGDIFVYMVLELSDGIRLVNISDGTVLVFPNLKEANIIDFNFCFNQIVSELKLTVLSVIKRGSYDIVIKQRCGR